MEGIFDADTLAFAPEAGVYIVDNVDPGCRVVEDRRVLDKMYNKREDSYKGSVGMNWLWRTRTENLLKVI